MCSNPTDKGLAELLAATVAGDETAAVSLYAALEPRLRSYAITNVPTVADADEVVQETLIALLRKAKTGAPIQSIAAYCTITARNKMFGLWREQGRRRKFERKLSEYSAVEIQGQRYDLGDFGESDEECLTVLALRKLKMKHQLVLWMHLWLGVPHATIAAVLEIDVGTSRTRLFNAKKYLQAAFEEVSRDFGDDRITNSRLQDWADSRYRNFDGQILSPRRKEHKDKGNEGEENGDEGRGNEDEVARKGVAE